MVNRFKLLCPTLQQGQYYTVSQLTTSDINHSKAPALVLLNRCLSIKVRFLGVNEQSLKRLIGTQVILIGSSTNTTCGTINSVSLDFDLENQTYTVPCPATSEPTLAVFLYDDFKLSDDNGRLIMRIVEVSVSGVTRYYFFFPVTLGSVALSPSGFHMLFCWFLLWQVDLVAFDIEGRKEYDEEISGVVMPPTSSGYACLCVCACVRVRVPNPNQTLTVSPNTSRAPKLRIVSNERHPDFNVFRFPNLSSLFFINSLTPTPIGITFQQPKRSCRREKGGNRMKIFSKSSSFLSPRICPRSFVRVPIGTFLFRINTLRFPHKPRSVFTFAQSTVYGVLAAVTPPLKPTSLHHKSDRQKSPITQQLGRVNGSLTSQVLPRQWYNTTRAVPGSICYQYNSHQPSKHTHA
eukprot:sb/3465275/